MNDQSWIKTPLRHICRLTPPVSFEGLKPTDKVTFLPMDRVKSGYFLPSSGKLESISSSHSAFNDGDILLAKVTPCFENGNIAIADELLNGRGFGSSELFVLRPTKVDSKFLFWYLQSVYFKSLGIASMTGASGLKRISSDFLRDHQILLPDHETQLDVVHFIDRETARIDTLITKKARFIELLKEKRQAVITKAVTKGLDDSVQMKDSGVEWLGKVPEHWKVARLKHLVSQCQNGVWGDDPLKDGTDTLCVRVADFDRESLKVVAAPATYRQVTTEHQVSRLVSKGDILLEKSGGGEKTLVGANVQYLGDEKAVCSNFVAVIKTSKETNPTWLNYLMSTMYDLRINLKSIKQATGIQNLDSEGYLNEIVAFPSIKEQSEIVDEINRQITRIDLLAKNTQRSIELLKEKRSALITAAVTGKIDVREVA